MAIGMSPIIPLNRVITDPNARFQRFGVNDSQLFGKPIEFVPQNQPWQQLKTVVRKAETPNPLLGPPERDPGGGNPQTYPAADSALTSVLTPDYSARPSPGPLTGALAFKPGSLVNLKA